jgi:phosphoribosylformimino-5-aminoimidazole carboxamide ribotide isomerase
MQNAKCQMPNDGHSEGRGGVRIIGVIDLLGGQAVHARGGCRGAYRPVETAAGEPIDGDPAALARVYAERLKLGEVYVADLDAIAGGAEQDEPVRAIASSGASVWLDAGVGTVAQAQRALSRGASRVVVGLETLPSFTALGDIVAAVGVDAVAFSLDLRDGRPMTTNAALGEMTSEAIARQAVATGVSSVIVLDVARVGSGRGLDWSLVESVRRAVPGVRLLAGGGVRSSEDLQRLAAIGCDAALVATALHGAQVAPFLRAGPAAGDH